MSYFYLKNEEAEAHVRKCITKAQDIIIRAIGPSVISLILYGSLARGEGIARCSSDNKLFLSDVDLLAILKRKRPIPMHMKRELHSLSEQFQMNIDMHATTLFRLRYDWLPTLRLDLEHSHKTLTGRCPNLSNLGVNPQELGMGEVMALVFHRAAKCLFHFYEASKDVGIASDSALRSEAEKTAVLCSDIISIRLGKYHTALVERNRVVAESDLDLNVDWESIKSDINHTIDQRFSGKYSEEPLQHWQRMMAHMYELIDACFAKDAGAVNWNTYMKSLPDWHVWWLRPIKVILNQYKLARALGKLGLKKTHWSFNANINIQLATMALHRARYRELNNKWLDMASKCLRNVYQRTDEQSLPEQKWNRMRYELFELTRLGAGPI